MENLFFSQLPAWVYLTIFTGFVCYLYLTRNYNYWKKRGVPGSKPYLFIGTFKPTWIYKLEDQDMVYFHKYGHTYGGFEGSQPVLYTTDPDAIRQFMVKDFPAFANRRKFTGMEKLKYAKDMVLILRGNEWKLSRNTLSPTFTTGKLKQMVYLIEECVEELLQSLEVKADNGESFEMTDQFAVLTLSVIASCAFGMKIDCIKNPHSEFVNEARNVFKSSPKLSYFMMAFPGLFKLLPPSITPNPFAYFTDTARKAIDMRIGNAESTRRDFLQILLEAEIQNDAETTEPSESKSTINNKRTMTRDSIIGNTIMFLLAGHETTASTLSFLAYELAINPDVQEKLISEIDDTLSEYNGKVTYENVANMEYLDMVVSEVLRLHPPAVRIERMCEQNGVSINGITLDYGVLVATSLYALHRNPEFYPDPEVFDPNRFSAENKAKRNPFAYIPFGAGPRNCIAMRFALTEIKIVIVHFLSKFRFQSWEKTEFPVKCISESGMRLPKSVNLQLQRRTEQSQE